MNRNVWLVALLLTGCDLGEPIQLGPAQPALVYVQGESKLPQGQPRGETVRLYTLDGRVIACGTILDDAGSFSLGVAPGALTKTPTLYQLALKDGATILYSAPLRLNSGSTERRQNIDAATTALWLAAKAAAQKGNDPLKWNFDRLLQESTVQEVASRIEGDVTQWSRDRRTPLTLSVQGQIERIVAIASKI